LGCSSNLTFALEPGWKFVETEDWRPDVEAAWAECGGDERAWIYFSFGFWWI
jgi:hypothetical protein